MVAKCVLPTTCESRDLEFRCPNCKASFSSKRGLGVQRRRKHPAEYEADENTQRTKERWTQKELLFMSECEVSIPLHIITCNQLLHPYFPHRTIESIKVFERVKGTDNCYKLQRTKSTKNPPQMNLQPMKTHCQQTNLRQIQFYLAILLQA